MVAARESDAEIISLYDVGQLGCPTPESIIHTMWFKNTLFFGMRGGVSEHRHLWLGDINLKFDADIVRPGEISYDCACGVIFQ